MSAAASAPEAFTATMPADRLVLPDTAFRIDEIMRRPILIVKSSPDRIVIVDRDRIADLQIGHGLLHIVDVLLVGELRSMHADHHKTLVFVFLGPRPDIRDCPQTIDAGIGPEIDENDLALE